MLIGLNCWFILIVLLVIFCTNCCLGSALNNYELKLVAIAHRHGERTPYKFFANDPYSDPKLWPDGKIQLTTKGKHRMYQIGLSLRNRYSDFLTDTPREVFARSSDADRCIESTQLIYHGLYKARGRWVYDNSTIYLPIPIHTVPTAQDGMLTTDCDCPEATKEKYRLLASKPAQNLVNKYADTLNLIAEKTGNVLTDLVNISDFYTTLLIEEDAGYKKPDWLTPKDMKALHIMSDINVYVTAGSEKILRLRLTKLFADLSSRINAKVNNDSDNGGALKFLSYSTHDNMLAQILTGLQIGDAKLPPYGAVIIFELVRSSTNEYYVRLFYWSDTNSGEPIAQEMPFCGNRTACPLDTFLNHIDQYISDDWEAECGLKSVNNIWLNIFVIILIVVIVLLVTAGLAWLVNATCFRFKDGYRRIS